MSRTLLFFYLLLAYVLLQFTWWAYLLIDLNQQLTVCKIQLMETLHVDPVKLSVEKLKFAGELKQRWMMVFGEGTVFLGLLIFGIYRVRSAFFREVSLARQQKNFLLSITHEFKSPVATIKLSLQTLQKRMLEPKQRQEVIQKALVETDRIDLLVENLLLASRLESHNYELYFEDINLSDFVHTTVSDFIERQDRDQTIQHSIHPGIHIKGDKLALTSLLNNLLENAVKYSPAGTTITVNLVKQHREAVITVSDEGIGIPPGEESKIFEKFYRVGNEETRRTKGTGLGLFIAHQVTSLHNGKISVSRRQHKGAVFEVHLPS